MDEDCEDFPNTVCKNTPVNIGLDPGTREIPFKGNNYSNIFLFDMKNYRIISFFRLGRKRHFVEILFL